MVRERASEANLSDYIRSRSDAKPISLTFTKLEKALLERPWQAVREGVDVKLLPQEGELYVLARSSARVDKERAMRRRKLKWLMARLRELAAMKLAREELLMKLGAARTKARAAWRLVDVEVDPRIAAFSYALNRENSAKCDGAKAVICCAPIFADASRRSCGDSIPSSPKSISTSHGDSQDSRMEGIGWERGGGRRRQGSGVARAALRLAMVAASTVTSFAFTPPTLIERLLSRPF